MSRMVTSVASFSSQRAAMRRACSSDVRSVSFLGRDGPSLQARNDGVECTGGSRTSGGAIEAEAVDRRGDRGGTRSSIGRSVRDPLADRRRTRRQRRDREQLDAVGAGQRAMTRSRSAHGRCPDASRRRSARARARARAASTSGTPRARRRRAGRRDRRAAAPRASRPCARTGRARPRRRRWARRRAPRAAAAARARVSTSLCPGSATTRTSRRSSPKCSIASRASATCPLWGGSKAPPRIPTAPLTSRS